MPERTIKVVGHDPSLRHWGLATGTYGLHSGQLHIDSLHVIQPELARTKQVRQNSLDIESAAQLYRHAAALSRGAQAIFIEIPVGSQSARAMASYGLCMGVLGALRASGIPFFELTPAEVKLAGAGHKTATKQEMIRWATRTHPQANWPTHLHHGIAAISEARAEHMADAVATIHAGLASSAFQQLLPILVAQPKDTHANQLETA